METVTLITAIAALITGAASLLMVLEMKKQRKAISRPVLKLLSKYSNARTSTGSLWSWAEKDFHGPQLKLLNFGTGPALNISIEWILNLQELIAAIKKYDPYDIIKIKEINGFINLDNSIHSFENQKKYTTEAIPVYSGDNDTYVNIPSYYIAFFEKFIQVAFFDRPKDAEGKSSNIKVPDFPSLEAFVSCEDINKDKISQRFLIHLNIICISAGKDDNSHEITVSFDVSEKNITNT